MTNPYLEPLFEVTALRSPEEIRALAELAFWTGHNDCARGEAGVARLEAQREWMYLHGVGQMLDWAAGTSPDEVPRATPFNADTARSEYEAALGARTSGDDGAQWAGIRAALRWLVGGAAPVGPDGHSEHWPRWTDWDWRSWAADRGLHYEGPVTR